MTMEENFIPQYGLNPFPIFLSPVDLDLKEEMPPKLPDPTPAVTQMLKLPRHPLLNLLPQLFQNHPSFLIPFYPSSPSANKYW